MTLDPGTRVTVKWGWTYYVRDPFYTSRTSDGTVAGIVTEKQNHPNINTTLIRLEDGLIASTATSSLEAHT